MPNNKYLFLSGIISVFASAAVGVSTGFVGSRISFPALETFLRESGLPLVSLESRNTTPPATLDTGKTVSLNEDDATAAVVKKISPAVVSIIISKEISRVSNLTGPNVFPFDDFFEFGFPFNVQRPSSTQPQDSGDAEPQKREVGGGTGFIIGSDGLILTNKHVVADTEAEYTVVMTDGKRYDAKVLAIDPFIDVALIKIEAKDLPTLSFGDSDKIQIGQTVIAIGNALSEFQNTVTKGVISGVNRRVVAGGGVMGTEVIEEAIQTDAAINPGNSGGPLVNLRGEVIGMNTAISRDGQLLGFAVPINMVKPALESFKKYGRIVYPWLGVRYVLLNKDIAKENSLPVDAGAIVVRGDKRTDLAVIPGSPADNAGIVENDIIIEMDGVKITEDMPLARMIQKHKPGDKVRIVILSKGKEKTLEVELGESK
ncbi:MAG: trypsin-like peptidase domain-containing protein [Patescibacteria group bacterium]